jgi:NAD(P)-dependent dehydrogenase (short-subunit alcohol dehydrogenase family)
MQHRLGDRSRMDGCSGCFEIAPRILQCPHVADRHQEDALSKAVIIGVGPDRGLGAQLCKRFAGEGLDVVAAGRTQAALDAVVADIERSAGKASSFLADATSEADVAALFDRAGADVDLAIYNAGNNTAGRILEMNADYFEKSWRVVCFGGFLFGREALRRMVPKKRGTILFTGASASLRGRAGYGAFNSAKAGLRTLAQAMAKEYGSDGIHVGHVVVDGAVDGDKIHSRFPDANSRPDRLLDIAGIVECYAFLYRQHRTAWSFEIDVRTFVEPW